MKKWIWFIIFVLLVVAVIWFLLHRRKKLKVREVASMIVNEATRQKKDVSISDVEKKADALSLNDLRLLESFIDARLDSNVFALNDLTSKVQKSKIPMIFSPSDARWKGIIYDSK